MKNLKMTKKLIVMFTVTGLLPILILSSFLDSKITEQIRENALQQNSTFFELASEAIDNYYSERLGDGLVLSTVPDVIEGLAIIEELGIDSSEWEEKYPDLDKLLAVAIEQYGFSEIFITDRHGNVVIASEFRDILEGASIASRDYFQIAMAGTQNWSEVFYSDIIYDNATVLSTPVYGRSNSTTPIGTVNIFIDQYAIDQIVHTGIERIGESGDSYVVNEEGLLFTNTRLGEYQENAAMNETIDTEVVRILADAIKREDLEFQFNDTYTDYMGNLVLGSAGLVQFGGTYGALIIEVDEAEALSAVHEMRSITILIVGVALLLGIAVALYFATTISKPITAAVEQAKVIASLDITKNIPDEFIDRKDEMGDLSKALQTIITNLRGTINEVSTSSEQVAVSAEELTATSNKAATAADEVTKTVAEIAAGASDQAQNTEEGSTKASLLGDSIENNQTHVKKLNDASQSVSKAVNEGLEEIENLTQIADESSKATNEVHEGIIKTNDSANKIGEASNVIASIAEQTNLLALNAAIEAARAGDAGKGFAVVAEEIRKLAEQSTTSTKTIDEVVRELQTNSKSAVEIMEKVSVVLKEQEESIKVSKGKYVTIAEAIKEVEKAVEELNVSGEEMEKMKGEILHTLHNLSAIAEENSASTEEVAATMDAQTASIQEISSASQGLSRLSQQLQSFIRKFKV